MRTLQQAVVFLGLLVMIALAYLVFFNITDDSVPLTSSRTQRMSGNPQETGTQQSGNPQETGTQLTSGNPQETGTQLTSGNPQETGTQLTSGNSQETASLPCSMPGAGMFALKQLPCTSLASFPGSGNWWTRYLLTTASGILTGTVYNEPNSATITSELKARYVLVVKTHGSPELAMERMPMDRCVLLIRNPYETFLAQFNRRMSAKTDRKSTAISPREQFEEKWEDYVTSTMRRWSSMYQSWSEIPTPLHVMVYSRLTSHLGKELRRAFHFLNVSANVDCAVRSPEGFDHRERPAWQDEVAVYSEQQRAFVNNAIDEVQAALEQRTGEKFDDFQSWKR